MIDFDFAALAQAITIEPFRTIILSCITFAVFNKCVLTERNIKVLKLISMKCLNALQKAYEDMSYTLSCVEPAGSKTRKVMSWFLTIYYSISAAMLFLYGFSIAFLGFAQASELTFLKFIMAMFFGIFVMIFGFFLRGLASREAKENNLNTKPWA